MFLFFFKFKFIKITCYSKIISFLQPKSKTFHIYTNPLILKTNPWICFSLESVVQILVECASQFGFHLNQTRRVKWHTAIQKNFC